MSGHSKWATTRRAKAIVDAKRSSAFTRITNLITMAAREKGGSLETNFTLRMAVDKAKAANMPKDNIEKAIKKGTGEIEGAALEELVYECVGPANSQFIVKAITDSKNRAAAEVRHIFSKVGGSMGAVMWNFSMKGVIRISSEELRDKNLSNNEDFELELIDAGAEDVQTEEEGATIYSRIEDLQKLQQFLTDKGVVTESAEIEYVAKDKIKVDDEEQATIDKLIDMLEDCDDVSEYYSNVG